MRAKQVFQGSLFFMQWSIILHDTKKLINEVLTHRRVLNHIKHRKLHTEQNIQAANTELAEQNQRIPNF